jgi:penicillin-binding protein 1A
MREVYRRKPAPPDWPRPDGIVERQVDLASGQLWAPGCGTAVTDYFLAGTDPIATCIPVANPNPAPEGMPGQGPTPVDTSFGFPAPTAPAPPHTDSGSITRVQTSPGVLVAPGAAPLPRPSGIRPSRDTVGRTDGRGTTTPAPRDTSNPFTLPAPPAPPQRR